MKDQTIKQKNQQQKELLTKMTIWAVNSTIKKLNERTKPVDSSKNKIRQLKV